MSAGRRGRVVKAAHVALAATAIPWQVGSALEEGPPAEVEVVREKGVVVSITVRCRCGRVHELELLGDADRSAEQGARS